ncbi:MAG: ABC transporter ATP-binding protein [Kineosporiaceae bacterium]
MSEPTQLPRQPSPGSPTPLFPVLPPPPRGEVRRAVTAALRRHRGGLGPAVGLVLVTTAAAFAVPLLTRDGVDAVLGGRGVAAVWPTALAVLGVTVAGSLTVALLGRVTATVGERMLHDLRRDAVAGTLGMAPRVVRGLTRGDVLTRLTGDVDTLSVAAREGVPAVVRAVALTVAGLAALVVLQPWLALTVAPVVLLGLPPAVRFLRASRPVYDGLQRAEADAAGVLSEIAESGRVISEARAAGRWRRRAAVAADGVVGAELAAMRLRNRLFPLLELLEAGGVAAVLAVGVVLLLRGEVTVGTLSGAALAVATVFGPVGDLLEWLDEMLAARAALTRVIALAARPPDVADAASPAPLPARGVLAAQGVRFRYGAGPEVLHGVDVTVAPGERIALVGPTGAGKSTLARLLARLDDPSSGRVTFGGVDLRAASLGEIRRRVVVIDQDGYVPEGTVADAVRWALPAAPDADVAAALDAVGAGPWWRGLPDGLATVIGPEGTTLSAGQRQLANLARAALTDPAVVVLDEATGRLDLDTEERVDAAVAALTRGRSVVVIAHRPGAAARADRVVRLAGGATGETSGPAPDAPRPESDGAAPVAGALRKASQKDDDM